MIVALEALATLVLYLLIEASNWLFLAGCVVGLVEVVGMIAFWPWAYRLGLRVGGVAQQHPDLPGLVTGERSGETRFAAYRVLPGGQCLFRRRRGFLNTILEWKGMVRLGGHGSESVAVVPLGPVVCGAAFLIGWSAFGLSLMLGGDIVAGLLICAVAVVGVGLTAREGSRTGRLRYQRYRDEVATALSSVA